MSVPRVGGLRAEPAPVICQETNRQNVLISPGSALPSASYFTRLCVHVLHLVPEGAAAGMASRRRKLERWRSGEMVLERWRWRDGAGEMAPCRDGAGEMAIWRDGALQDVPLWAGPSGCHLKLDSH